MSRNFSKAIVFAIAVVFVMAPFVLAQTSGTGSGATSSSSDKPVDRPATGAADKPATGAADKPATGAADRPATGATGQPATGAAGTQSQMAAQDAISATVADIDQQRHTLKLRMQSGETVELKVPERSLMHLQKGDSVQVSIRKAEAQPGMGATQQPATQPSRPGPSPSGSSPSDSGTKSR